MNDRARVRAGSTHPRRGPWSPWSWRVVATVLSLGLMVGAVAVATRSSSDTRVATPAGSGSLPSSVLAIAGSTIVELSSLDGAIRRELAHSATGTARTPDDPGGWGSLSVSGDARLAIATGGGAPRTCPQSLARGSDLTRINLVDGTVGNIDLGAGALAAYDPEIAPDGTRFAYVEDRCQPEPRMIDTAKGRELVIRDVAGTELRRFTLPYRSPADGNHTEIIGIAGWEADGRHLLVQIQHEPTVELWRVESENPSGTLVGETLPTPPSVLLISVLPVPLRDSGRWAATLRRLGSEPAQVVAYDPYTATIGPTLLNWPTLRADTGSPTVVAADSTGRHLLMAVTFNGGPTVLYRWSEGDAEPTALGENLGDDAAWLPGGAQPPSTGETGTAPSTANSDRPLASPGTVPATIPPSTVPPSPEADAVRAAFLGWIDTQPRDAVGPYVEDWESIKDAVMQAADQAPLPLDGYTGRVDAVLEIRDGEAFVIYSFLNSGQVAVPELRGSAVKIDGVWMVSRETVCQAIAIGGVQCPPRSPSVSR